MLGFFDLEFKMDDINKHEPPLQKLDKVINWEIFHPILESELLNKNKGKGSRPPFDKLLMFNILILQRYFNLSDDQTAFQIKDRLSFMELLNLELSDKIPDAKTIWLFKERLGKIWTHRETFWKKTLINIGSKYKINFFLSTYVSIIGQYMHERHVL